MCNMKECPGVNDNCCEPIMDSEDYCESCKRQLRWIDADDRAYERMREDQ